MTHPNASCTKAARTVSALGTSLLIVLAGCGDGGSNGPPPDQPSPPAGITLEELRAAEYPVEVLDGAMVRLTAGVFTPADSSRRDIASMELHPMTAISAPGPDQARAAAIIMESGGGTGMFYWLHLLERTAASPSVVASAYLGDRVEIIALGFAGDTVVVRLVTQGPTDAFCCPTLEVVKRFVRSGSELVEAGTEQ